MIVYAFTSSSTPQAGTSFILVSDPADARRPQVGDKLIANTPIGTKVSGKITEASSTEIQFDDEQGKSYRLTPRRHDELPFPLETPGMAKAEWVLRELTTATS